MSESTCLTLQQPQQQKTCVTVCIFVRQDHIALNKGKVDYYSDKPKSKAYTHHKYVFIDISTYGISVFTGLHFQDALRYPDANILTQTTDYLYSKL